MMEHLDMNQHEPAKMEVNRLKLEETGPHLKMEDFRKGEDQSWDCSQEEENALRKVNASPETDFHTIRYIIIDQNLCLW